MVVNATAFDTGEVVTVSQHDLSVSAGAGAIEWFKAPAIAAVKKRANVLEVSVIDQAGAVVTTNVVPLSTPGDMWLSPSEVEVLPLRAGPTQFVASVRCSAVSMFATLTTLAHGRFDDNAVLLRPPGRNITFHLAEPSPHESAEAAWQAFSQSIRVEDVAAYQHSNHHKRHIVTA